MSRHTARMTALLSFRSSNRSISKHCNTTRVHQAQYECISKHCNTTRVHQIQIGVLVRDQYYTPSYFADDLALVSANYLEGLKKYCLLRSKCYCGVLDGLAIDCQSKMHALLVCNYMYPRVAVYVRCLGWRLLCYKASLRLTFE